MSFIPILSGLSILIAGIIALMRFGKISRLYYPFIFCVWLAVVNEVLSLLLIEEGYYTTINNNVYSLLEAGLYAAFFWNIGIFRKIPRLFFLLSFILLLEWIWENFFHSKITYVGSWFMIAYSFGIVLMGITAINKMLLSGAEKEPGATESHPVKNPVLLISIGAIVYFSFAVLVEVFWLYGLNSGREFRIKIYDIIVYINIAVNLIYALAILWVPHKRTSTTPY